MSEYHPVRIFELRFWTNFNGPSQNWSLMTNVYLQTKVAIVNTTMNLLSRRDINRVFDITISTGGAKLIPKAAIGMNTIPPEPITKTAEPAPLPQLPELPELTPQTAAILFVMLMAVAVAS
jgi:hypothetical protein